ncbi:glycosyltransferase family 2 protein [Algoriphagus sp. H41]|uniref:Glycosyltransferase family 2 protein n=1 Tax=Algoriphagus oliviformis TaxID=2811231 RepID=A0ABS3BYC7_9BACT|nr:glycosyltransferase family 2 protein [Algoriphagus oliviformis]MBN7809688.1 glycosyltransferase family 2 protein [Algoriphagus oliviformis]
MVFIPEASVAIILVNWNGLDFTKACLSSLRQVDFPSYKIFLVDNASQNQEGQKLKSLFPELELIQNEENLGFAGGNNMGIRAALVQGFSHVLLLNNDTEVEPDFLGEMMLRIRQQPRLGLVQPLILFLGEKKKIWSAGGKWIPSLGRAVTLGDREPLAGFRFAKDLDWATGCCMLISREALLEVGLLNEQYFAYFEDVEWSLRFRAAGFFLGLAERAVIYHEAGAASKKKHAEGVLSPRVFYLHVRNQFFLLRKSLKGIYVPVGFAYHSLRFVLWLGYFLARGRFEKMKSVAKGMVDGLTEPLKSAPKWP